MFAPHYPALSPTSASPWRDMSRFTAHTRSASFEFRSHSRQVWGLRHTNQKRGLDTTDVSRDRSAPLLRMVRLQHGLHFANRQLPPEFVPAMPFCHTQSIPGRTPDARKAGTNPPTPAWPGGELSRRNSPQQNREGLTP